MAKLIWKKLCQPALRPQQAADLFAHEAFDPPRQVVDLSGEWQEKFPYYRGRFRLESSDCWYDLSCDSWGSWLVSRGPAVAPEKAVGSRAIEFSEEDADQLRGLLDAPAGAPGRPKLEPRSIPPEGG